jgi:hypothetical protein
VHDQLQGCNPSASMKYYGEESRATIGATRDVACGQETAPAAWGCRYTRPFVRSMTWVCKQVKYERVGYVSIHLSFYYLRMLVLCTYQFRALFPAYTSPVTPDFPFWKFGRNLQQPGLATVSQKFRLASQPFLLLSPPLFKVYFFRAGSKQKINL